MAIFCHLCCLVIFHILGILIHEIFSGNCSRLMSIFAFVFNSNLFRFCLVSENDICYLDWLLTLISLSCCFAIFSYGFFDSGWQMKNASWLPEEDLKGLSDNFFDDLINHIDFPLEDIETANDEGDWDAGFQNLVPPPLDVLTNMFTCGNTCKGQRVRIQKPVPILVSSYCRLSTLAYIYLCMSFESNCIMFRFSLLTISC